MKRSELTLMMVFTAAFIIVITWVRHNLPIFRPILEIPSFSFQLVLAVTVIAILRNIVGIRTFGVFGPTIIALGLTVSGPLWGLVLYFDIFIIAMFTSLMLAPLAMASSHRVAIVITVTIVTITVLDLIGQIYHIRILESSEFFPILITSWLGDRYVRQVREINWVRASTRLAGTVVTIIIAYFTISLEPVVNFIAINPETWAFLILINVFLSEKVNFRFSEFFRFRPITDTGIDRNDILSLNKRNREYIFRYNQTNLFTNVEKDKMKVLLHQLDIPTPKTYGIIQSKKDLEYARKIMRTEKSFVIKPGKGSGGEGILVVDREQKGGKDVYVSKGEEYSLKRLLNHIVLILEGQYSLEWIDAAVIEEKVETDPLFAQFYWKGVPDIRVIVFEGFPVMAMTRLPTKESEGKANIHKGAVSMGLSIAEGKGIHPFWSGRGGAIERHPDTDAVLTDMKIPDWSRYLRIACLSQAASGLGYVGVDIVPSTRGPLVLEVNIRAGIEIQNANIAGLLKRLKFVEAQLQEHKFKPVEERVSLSQEWDSKGWV